LIGAASSSNVSGLKNFLGWDWLASIWSRGTSSRMSSAVGVAESRAPRPRPSPRLFMLQHLPGELEICDRPTRSQFMDHHGLPVACCSREAPVPRTHRFEVPARKVPV